MYHKEEYGDHKTFHDEFLDTDHQHNYDDHHEHQEVEGGKFSKGKKLEGKKNKFDKGDEKHEWGKEEFDVHNEGKHDRGGNKSKHRHATKKHQGHYDANAHREKNSVHKIKNGSPPPYVHHSVHHGPHQAQIEPFVPHHNSHHEPINVPSPDYIPPVDTHSHQAPYVGHDSPSDNVDPGNHYHSHSDHHNNHGSHQHTFVGPSENVHNDESYSQQGGQDDYQERTAKNPQHRSSGKALLEEKSNGKFIPIVKEEVIHKQDPIEQNKDQVVRTHETSLYKNQPVVHIQNPVVPVHELRVYKHQPHTHNHQPHAHNHHTHAHNHQTQPHKHSFSPNREIKYHRKPVHQDNSQFRSPPPGYEKFSEPFNDRFNNHNHRIRYGYQPRNHQQHNHNHRFHHSHHHNHQNQQQPFPRFAGINHHLQSHGHHHQPHHHGSSKNHSQHRHTPSNYQPAHKSDVHVLKPEPAPFKPSKSEDQHVISQKRYE